MNINDIIRAKLQEEVENLKKELTYDEIYEMYANKKGISKTEAYTQLGARINELQNDPSLSNEDIKLKLQEEVETLKKELTYDEIYEMYANKKGISKTEAYIQLGARINELQNDPSILSKNTHAPEPTPSISPLSDEEIEKAKQRMQAGTPEPSISPLSDEEIEKARQRMQAGNVDPNAPTQQIPDNPAVDPNAQTQKIPTIDQNQTLESTNPFGIPDKDFDDFTMYLKHKLGLRMPHEQFKEYLMNDKRAQAYLGYASEYMRKKENGLPEFNQYMGPLYENFMGPTSKTEDSIESDVTPEEPSIEPELTFEPEEPSIEPELTFEPEEPVIETEATGLNNPQRPSLDPNSIPNPMEPDSNTQEVAKEESLNEKPELKAVFKSWLDKRSERAKQAIQTFIEKAKSKVAEKTQTEEPTVNEYAETQQAEPIFRPRPNFINSNAEVPMDMFNSPQNINEQGGRSR